MTDTATRIHQPGMKKGTAYLPPPPHILMPLSPGWWKEGKGGAPREERQAPRRTRNAFAHPFTPDPANAAETKAYSSPSLPHPAKQAPGSVGNLIKAPAVKQRRQPDLSRSSRRLGPPARPRKARTPLAWAGPQPPATARTTTPLLAGYSSSSSSSSSRCRAKPRTLHLSRTRTHRPAGLPPPACERAPKQFATLPRDVLGLVPVRGGAEKASFRVPLLRPTPPFHASRGVGESGGGL